MGLLDKLNQETRPKGRPCRTARLLADLPEDTADKVNEILQSIVANEGRYSASWLADQLTSEGYFANHSSLLRHARGTCCCES